MAARIAVDVEQVVEHIAVAVAYIAGTALAAEPAALVRLAMFRTHCKALNLVVMHFRICSKSCFAPLSFINIVSPYVGIHNGYSLVK